ncbi:MAG TPA: hypothetical protein VMD51_04360 [Mycobacterium sp.]|nr:hypothetical protein [Mycobacterium sp.]
MDDKLAALFEDQDGVATSEQILTLVSRRYLETVLECTAVERIWRGVYSLGVADTSRRLKGLDLAGGEVVAICLATAAGAYVFDTQSSAELHVLNPSGHQLRPVEGLVVHRRDGAPLITVSGRPATAPAWTAIEVARTLRRPRALATLDAALRSGRCDPADLTRAVLAQQGRRGIVKVRQLLPLADARAESPMESEARLVMLDGGLPSPVLQHEVIDACGRLRRLDFAWPDYRVAAEYDSDEWHVGAEALRRDRRKLAALQDLGWVVVPIVADDVRRQPTALVDRIRGHLDRAAVA